MSTDQDTDAWEDREAAERQAKERRRTILERVKDRTIHLVVAGPHTFPRDLKAVEAEPSPLPLEVLRESKLTITAEAGRDWIYPCCGPRTAPAPRRATRRNDSTERRPAAVRTPSGGLRHIEAGVAHAV